MPRRPAAATISRSSAIPRAPADAVALEAVRAGFRRALQAKDYATIVDVARKIRKKCFAKTRNRRCGTIKRRFDNKVDDRE